MRMRRILVIGGSLALATISAPYACTEALYLDGLHQAPALPTAPTPSLTRTFEALVWLSCGETLPEHVERIRPWTLAMEDAALAYSFDARVEKHKGFSAAWLIARSQPRSQSRPSDVLPNTSVAVWIARNWSASQMAESLADTAYFTRGAYGFHAGSRAWFDRDPDQLTLGQAAFLSLIWAHPWCECRPEELRQRRDGELVALRDAGLIDTSAMNAAQAEPMPTPATSCPAHEWPQTP